MEKNLLIWPESRKVLSGGVVAWIVRDMESGEILARFQETALGLGVLRAYAKMDELNGLPTDQFIAAELARHPAEEV